MPSRLIGTVIKTALRAAQKRGWAAQKSKEPSVTMKGEALTMENMMNREPIWKLWVDTQRRVVSFHEEAGSQLMEFRDRDMFLRCIDGYTAQLYRYQ